MNGASGFREVRSSAPRSSTNRLLDEQRPQFGKVSGAVSVLTISLLSPQPSAQSEKRFLTPFPSVTSKIRH